MALKKRSPGLTRLVLRNLKRLNIPQNTWLGGKHKYSAAM